MLEKVRNLMLKTKNSDYNTLHTETPLLHPSFLHSHINQYGRLFTAGHRIMPLFSRVSGEVTSCYNTQETKAQTM